MSKENTKRQNRPSFRDDLLLTINEHINKYIKTNEEILENGMHNSIE